MFRFGGKPWFLGGVYLILGRSDDSQLYIIIYYIYILYMHIMRMIKSTSTSQSPENLKSNEFPP
jgi:hypothetical protein